MGPAERSIEVTAAGPRAVLLPGNGMMAEFYLPLARELAARDVGTTLVTLPGFGGLPPLPEPGWSALLDHVRPLVVGADALIGHSLGGLLAFLLAAELGDALPKLVLLEPAVVPWRWLAPAASRRYLRGNERPEIHLEGPGFRRVGRPADFPPAAFELAAWGHRVADRPTVRALVLGAPALYPLPWGQITARTLLVRGSESGRLMTLAQRAQARGLRHAATTVLPGAGHWLANEDDPALAALLAAFLTGP